ncbi:hypothetical protein RJ55_08002 [Drechmeria coniospora]|nr:hypothetical protein RJ55_08002 [Drechmeria coniospora]
MMASDRTVLVLYGSETGNAQDMAEELAKLCQRLHFRTCVEELDAVDLNVLLQHQLVIFALSTTGQGDMPHNSLLFWRKLLRRSLPPGCLAPLQYTCVGLGDSTYIKVDGSFVRWADGLRKHLLEHFPPREGLQPIPEHVNLPPRWSLEPALDAPVNPSPDRSKPGQATSPPLDIIPLPDGWSATIAANKRLTSDTHWQDVRLISFDIPSRGPGQKLHCSPGDCLTLYPKNFPDDAQRLITLMGWDSVADKPLDLSLCRPLPRALYPPAPCTVRTLLLHNIDFTAVPRRSFLKSISYFASDQDQKDRLLEFCSTEFLDEYFDYATRARRTIVEVLEEFWSVRVPPERILDVFPLIRGRDFSIANGGAQLIHPCPSRSDTTRVELVVALVSYRTILRKPRQGLCSRYLADLPAGVVLGVTHKPVLSPVHGPANARRPLIAMATGTGVAPVRCLLHERLTHPSAAPVLLFFGNRNRAADFLFRDEWESLVARGLLLLFPAFSRDQREKVYVQDLVRREAARLADLIPQHAIFAVCGGSTKMADACKNAVFDPFNEAGDEQERRKTLAEITWWQEIW